MHETFLMTCNAANSITSILSFTYTMELPNQFMTEAVLNSLDEMIAKRVAEQFLRCESSPSDGLVLSLVDASPMDKINTNGKLT